MAHELNAMRQLNTTDLHTLSPDPSLQEYEAFGPIFIFLLICLHTKHTPEPTHFNHEDGGSMFLRNVAIRSQFYTVSQFRRLYLNCVLHLDCGYPPKRNTQY